jgi:diacylglycerol kinase (ATP)
MQIKNKFLGIDGVGYHPVRKIRVALDGLRFAVRHDLSVTYKLIASMVILGVTFYYHEWVDVLVILVATALVVTGELFNSSIEALCDFVELAENEKITVIKDIAAAAAGVSIVAWGAVLVFEYGKVLGRWIG